VDSPESGSVAVPKNSLNLLLEFIANAVLSVKASGRTLENARTLVERPTVRASLYILSLSEVYTSLLRSLKREQFRKAPQENFARDSRWNPVHRKRTLAQVSQVVKLDLGTARQRYLGQSPQRKGAGFPAPPR
jgi:hypothetical protein